MVETLDRTQNHEYKTHIHEKGKYVLLNRAEQTPHFWQKYRVGTGIAITRVSHGIVIRRINCTHKKFLSALLDKYTPEEIVACKWVPNKLMKAEKLARQECYPGECVKSCVQYGCFCIDGICKNGM